MAKGEVLTFRPNAKCRRKILELMQDNLSRTEVLEEAVDYYYAMKKNQLTDDPIYRLMKTTINESMTVWFDDINKQMIGQRHDMQFALAYLDMCMKGFGFESDEEKALELARKTSSFKRELDRYISFTIQEKEEKEGD